MAKLVNVTPHPIKIYKSDAPDVINNSEQHTLFFKRLILPELKTKIAHLKELELGEFCFDDETIQYVQYGLLSYTPPQEADKLYIVPPVTALACKRNDFVIPYRLIRNDEGTVVGCRSFARPI